MGIKIRTNDQSSSRKKALLLVLLFGVVYIILLTWGLIVLYKKVFEKKVATFFNVSDSKLTAEQLVEEIAGKKGKDNGQGVVNTLNQQLISQGDTDKYDPKSIELTTQAIFTMDNLKVAKDVVFSYAQKVGNTIYNYLGPLLGL